MLRNVKNKKTLYPYQRSMHILFKSKKVENPMGHAYSVSDQGAKTEKSREGRKGGNQERKECGTTLWHRVIWGGAGCGGGSPLPKKHNQGATQHEEQPAERA